MSRWLAGIAAVLLFVAGAVIALQGRAEEPSLPPAPQPRTEAVMPGQLSQLQAAPEADPKSKELKRFDRADKNEDGRIALEELIEPRRKAFAKLDVNSDGRLSFEEWAVKTIDKFDAADADGNNMLTRAEYAKTAPKQQRPKKAACSC